jgi:Spy/CpxP family protein refolding chaperone
LAVFRAHPSGVHRRFHNNPKYTMNVLNRSLLTLAFAAAFVSPLAYAEPSAQPPTAAGEQTGGKARKTRKPRVERAERLAAELGLSDEQTGKVKALFKEEAALLKAVSQDKELERKEKMARNKEIRETFAAKIRELLTPEQQAKFDALAKRRGPGGAKGEAPADEAQ